MQTRVLIVDDHPLFRAAMRQALSSVVGDAVVEAGSLGQAIELINDDANIDLVFLDLNMPGNNGLTGLTELRTRFPELLVVIVSAQEDPVVIQKAMDLGSSGYIPKSSSLDDIEAAVKTVMDGEQWLPEALDGELSQLPPQHDVAFAARLSQLTPHQFIVLRMLADGLLNKQIAYELNISESTVKQHVSAVLRKLEVINRTQAGVIFKQLMQIQDEEAPL